MMNFTLDELSEFSQSERKMVEEAFSGLETTPEPSTESIDRILAYSRALSVRRTKRSGVFSLVLN